MTTLTIPDDPKMIREALCVAQHAVNYVNQHVSPQNKHGASEILQALIDECDRHRPLGPDGKHGDRHTATCGCDHDARCISLTDSEFNDRCDCRTLAVIDSQTDADLAGEIAMTNLSEAIIIRALAAGRPMTPAQRLQLLRQNLAIAIGWPAEPLPPDHSMLDKVRDLKAATRAL